MRLKERHNSATGPTSEKTKLSENAIDTFRDMFDNSSGIKISSDDVPRAAATEHGQTRNIKEASIKTQPKETDLEIKK